MSEKTPDDSAAWRQRQRIAQAARVAALVARAHGRSAEQAAAVRQQVQRDLLDSAPATPLPLPRRRRDIGLLPLSPRRAVASG